MKKQIGIFLIVMLTTIVCDAQIRKDIFPNAHSHNDYLQKIPFQSAFDLGFGSIEVDIYEKDGILYAAHEKKEIDKKKTLKDLYLDPLVSAIKINSNPKLQLLIDLKEAKALDHLVEILKQYPSITKNVKIVVSGEMPQISEFKSYPKWLYFDGRSDQIYTKTAFKRIGLVSESAYKLVGKWDHKTPLNEEKIKTLKDFAHKNHAKHKKVRLWGTPNTIEAYKILNELGFDFVGTDDLNLLISVLKN